jgi:glycosyltransferase involved in cell wall biosynthesis
MRISIIHNLYPPYARGGAEAVAQAQAEGLRKRGHEVEVISTKPNNPQMDIETGSGTTFIKSGFYSLGSFGYAKKLFWHFENLFSIRNYFRIRSILAKSKPDIVLTHNLMGLGMLVPEAVRRQGSKHIHTLHDIQLIHPSGLMYYGEESKIDSLWPSFYQAIVRKLFRPPFSVISPSEWLLFEHLKRGYFKGSQAAVILNPVDPAEASKPESGQDIDTSAGKTGAEGPVKFFYAGQLEKHKGIEIMIKAFSELDSTRTGGAVLAIAGEGSLLRSIMGTKKEWDGIKILGRVPRTQVASLLRRSDCLIMPSICYENSPSIICEAFAAGVPVTASEIGGIPELVNGENGMLFKPGDGRDLKDKMQWAVEHKAGLKKMGEKGKEFSRKFSLERYLDRIEALF